MLPPLHAAEPRRGVSIHAADHVGIGDYAETGGADYAAGLSKAWRVGAMERLEAELKAEALVELNEKYQLKELRRWRMSSDGNDNPLFLAGAQITCDLEHLPEGLAGRFRERAEEPGVAPGNGVHDLEDAGVEALGKQVNEFLLTRG